MSQTGKDDKNICTRGAFPANKGDAVDRAVQNNIMRCIDSMLVQHRLERTHAQIEDTRREEGMLEEGDRDKRNWWIVTKLVAKVQGDCKGSPVLTNTRGRFMPVPFASEEQEAESIRAAARERVYKRYGAAGSERRTGPSICTLLSQKGLQLAARLGIGRARDSILETRAGR
jgi:hypothetical protein